MKVKAFLRKINAGTLKIPVYLQEGIMGEPRETHDFFDHHFDEQDRTVCSIDIQPNRVIVYYK